MVLWRGRRPARGDGRGADARPLARRRICVARRGHGGVGTARARGAVRGPETGRPAGAARRRRGRTARGGRSRWRAQRPPRRCAAALAPRSLVRAGARLARRWVARGRGRWRGRRRGRRGGRRGRRDGPHGQDDGGLAAVAPRRRRVRGDARFGRDAPRAARPRARGRAVRTHATRGTHPRWRPRDRGECGTAARVCALLRRFRLRALRTQRVRRGRGCGAGGGGDAGMGAGAGGGRAMRARFLGVLAVGAALVARGLAAQGTRMSEACVGSETEIYLRALALNGLLGGEAWSLRPFSPATLERWSHDSLGAHPWMGHLGAAPGQGITVLRPSVSTSYNSAFPWGFNDGAVWQGKGANVWGTAGAEGRWGVLTIRFEPVAFLAQNASFPLLVPESGP